VNAVLQYKNWNLTFESSVLPLRNDRPGVFFQGTEGTLDLTRSGYIFQPYKGAPEVHEAKENLEIAHATSFLDAIKNGTKPSADMQTGIAACNPVHLAKAAYWQRKRMKFDATGQKMVEDI
jgi:hypothetical protein